MDSSNQENLTSDGNGGQSYEYYNEQPSNPEVEYQTEYEQLSPLREQDRFLPIANVSKIMKKGVPFNGKISKEAKEIVQECVSEYISFITSEAAEKCQQEKRKTINGEDLLWAMANLGFDQSVEPLRLFLTKYREANKLDSSMLEAESNHHSSHHHDMSTNSSSNIVLTSSATGQNSDQSSGGVTTISANTPLTGTYTTTDGSTIYIRDGNVVTAEQYNAALANTDGAVSTGAYTEATTSVCYVINQQQPSQHVTSTLTNSTSSASS